MAYMYIHVHTKIVPYFTTVKFRAKYTLFQPKKIKSFGCQLYKNIKHELYNVGKNIYPIFFFQDVFLDTAGVRQSISCIMRIVEKDNNRITPYLIKNAFFITFPFY